MTISRVTGTGWASLVRVVAGGPRTLWRDLNRSAGAPLAPVPGQRGSWLAWLLHLLVGALAVALGAVAGGEAATDAGVPVGLALILGLAQGLPLVVALHRPMAGVWLSLVAGMLVSEVIRAGGAGPVWAEPSLLTHLGVLALVGLQARPRVLVELWLLTLGAGAILVQRMPGLNASPDLAEMTTLSAIVLVALVVTTFDLDEYVYEALRAGASGFLLKDASAETLAEAVRVVAAGDAMLSPQLTRRLLGTFARLGGPRAPTRDQVEGLTERETEVLTLVARGRSNAEIAQDLVLAEQTVKTHVSRILTKLGLRDRTQAAIFAYETGLVRPDDR